MRIYFATPFTNIAKPNKNSKYGWVSDDYINWVKNIVEKLESLGYKVFCPYRDTHNWGKSFPDLKELCREQYNKITKETDCLIAYLGEPQSAGVAIEIGYAISHKIPVIIIKKPEEKITLLAHGLDSISSCKIIEFENDEDLIQKLKQTLSKF